MQCWCGRRDSNPHALVGHQDLNLAWLPFHHSRALATMPEAGAQSMPRSRRSFATCPVAFTLYCASSTVPWGSTTTVERMTPVTVLP